MAGLKQVQRQTGVALWRQIADRIREAISNGAYDETGMVPPETMLAAIRRQPAYGAQCAGGTGAGGDRPCGTRSRHADRTQGAAEFPDHKAHALYAGIGDQAREMRGLLLDEAKEEAGAEVARWLGLKPGEQVIRLETLRQADKRPVSRATSWFPAERFAGIGEAYRAGESITKAFAELGLPDYVRATTEVTAAHASAADMADLELTPGAILLIAKAMNTDLDGVPVQYSISRFAADRVQFTIEN